MIVYRCISERELACMIGIPNYINAPHGKNTFKYNKDIQYKHFFYYYDSAISFMDSQNDDRYYDKYSIIMAYDINDEILKEYNVDSSTAGNMVNNFNYINEIYAWAMFSLDKANNVIKASIRSRGPVINEIASHFNGGGHALASGARLKDFNEVDKLVLELDEACRVYTSFIKETTEE